MKLNSFARLQAYLRGQMQQTKGAHFNSFDIRYTFPPLPTQSELLAPGYVAGYDYNLVYNSSDIHLSFVTTWPSPTLNITNSSCLTAARANTTCYITVPGFAQVTENGTQVGLFSFRSIYLGPTVTVNVTGDRALVIISRSTAIYDTPIIAAPGTLGVR